MLVTFIFFILGFIFLIKGADLLIDGASSVAKRLGWSTFFIGLTVVAFGTSAPELAINTVANISGRAGIALGNIVGANVSNTLLVLGIAAIIAPLAVKRSTVNKEIPFSLLAVIAVGILANDLLIDGQGDSRLSRIDGLILILFFSIFVFYTFGINQEKDNILQKTVGEMKDEPRLYAPAASAAMIIAGIGLLVWGGQWIVAGASALARYFGVREAIIGLTVVSIGTTLPELSASAMAARKGKTDIAVGNIVGSNIINLLWILGLSATIKPINFLPALNADILILAAVTILLLFFIYIGRKNILGRREGMVLAALYFVYIVFMIFRT